MCFKGIKRHRGEITKKMFVKIIPTRSSSVRKSSLKGISFRSFQRLMNLITVQVITLIITNIKHLFQKFDFKPFKNFVLSNPKFYLRGGGGKNFKFVKISVDGIS